MVGPSFEIAHLIETVSDAGSLEEVTPNDSLSARQLVEATSAALLDPFLELVAVASSPFWSNVHNREAAQRTLPLQQESKHALFSCNPSFRFA